jgi:uncharacterized membrane protein
VLAIIFTILVLERSAPEEPTLEALRPLIPTFLSYTLSFVFVAIYWNNHHHLLQAVGRVDGRVLWANVHLLFWLSLVPFVTAWMGENDFAEWPMALDGIVLVRAGIAYFILVRALIAVLGLDSKLGQAVQEDFKGKISVVIYVIAIPLAFVSTWISGGLYVLVAIIWLVPDRRIENVMVEEK